MPDHINMDKPERILVIFPLRNGSFELRIPTRISKSDFDRLKKLIDLLEDSLVDDAMPDPHYIAHKKAR